MFFPPCSKTLSESLRMRHQGGLALHYPQHPGCCLYISYLLKQAMAWCLRAVLSGGESRSLWPNGCLSWGLVRDLEPGCRGSGCPGGRSSSPAAVLKRGRVRLGEGGLRGSGAQAFLMRTGGIWEFIGNGGAVPCEVLAQRSPLTLSEEQGSSGEGFGSVLLVLSRALRTHKEVGSSLSPSMTLTIWGLKMHLFLITQVLQENILFANSSSITTS